MSELADIEFEYAWTCPKCGCHVHEGETLGWIENRKICASCRNTFLIEN